MLKSFRLCPLVCNLTLLRSWLLTFVPFSPTTVDSVVSVPKAKTSCHISLWFFFFNFFWLSLVVCLRGWCRGLRWALEWIRAAVAETTTCHFQSVTTPPEATTPASMSSSPCFHFSFSLLFPALLLCSSSALPVHLPHRLRAKPTGGCTVPGSSVGHRGHRHLLQVYTTNSFMTHPNLRAIRLETF